ncbi:MAG: hypothetical protein NC344_11285 [Bacteroidales bacterium]|nr:hypothetical protein [Bacteroidales bacterium]MCM1148389.1 hypothetical protein [Bacteroidales bacterium]MCM1207136.1 hypothetical protein [Bacillota bacterium]MCM1511369.1 hypothetical protein [Clostridium sp.]
MKKIMLMAATVMMSLAANAQNPDGLKQVMAASKYSEANELLKTASATMLSTEKAKAYNKLVDLAIAECTKAEENAVKAQLAKDDADMNKQNAKKAKAAYNAVKNAMLCNDADNEPNEKGQVKPKFQTKNAARIIPVRNTLINSGLDSYNSKDYAAAQKYFGLFAESRQDPLFAKTDFSAETNYGQICYYAALAAYFNKDAKKCSKYADYALNSGDKEIVNDAITVKLGSLEEQAKAGQIDTLKYISNVKKLSKDYPENEGVFGKLVALYDESGDKDGAQKVLCARLKENPNDAMANAYVGQNAQSENKYDEAIAAYEKALQAKPDFLAAKLNVGICYLGKAAAAIDANSDARGNVKPEAKDGIVADLNKAKTLIEEVKTADPDKGQVNWTYPLERVNYILENIK